eukprot:6807492-Karenia_brevis.AAC.1
MDGMAEGKNGSASTPPMPPADSLKMKAKQYQEAQEHYKEMVNKFGEDHFLTMDVKKSLDSFAPQVSSLKVLQNSKIMTETQMQTCKALDNLKKEKEAAQQ